MGDETFIIAAILAMKHPRAVIFLGAITALAAMTVAVLFIDDQMAFLTQLLMLRLFLLLLASWYHPSSVLNSHTMQQRCCTRSSGHDYCTLPTNRLSTKQRSARHMNLPLINVGLRQEEIKDVQGKLAMKKESPSIVRRWLMRCCTPVLLEACLLTFVAGNDSISHNLTLFLLSPEWGDRSQIATITLASHLDPIGVAIGAIIGHSICTGLAVIGGCTYYCLM